MSGAGTDYTLTATLGLYKPIANMAVGLWGDLWNSNADAIDAAIHFSTGGGPYLPLAGATVFGPTTFSGTTIFTGPLTYTATGASTVRSAQDRAAQPYSIRDFGAVLDGVTSDQTALTNTFAATPALSTINVPPGNINFGSFAPTSKPMLWRMSGNYTGSGTTIIAAIGNGIVENMLPTWTKAFFRGSSVGITSLGPAVRIDSTLNHAGGTAGGVEALQVNAYTTAASTAAAFPFAISGRLTMSSTQVNGPAGVGIFGSATRAPGAGNSSPFAANFLTDDQTGLSSVNGGSAVGTEVDLKANKLDDGTLADGFQFAAGTYSGAQRAVLTVQYGRSDRTDNTPMEVAKILQLGLFSATVDGAYCSAKLGINVQGTISFAGLSFLHATLGASAQAIALQNEQRIAWTTAASNVVPTTWNALQYTTTGTARLRYMVGATERLSFPDAKPVVSGSRGTATVAVLTALLTALNGAGIITDSTAA